MSAIDVMADWSKKRLHEVPKEIISMSSLKMLYLEGNYISNLPEDVFVRLPKLVWFDVRNNKIKSIPKSIAYHNSLETLLVQGNDIDVLPVELCLVPHLKVLQCSQNPLRYPAPKIVEEGLQSIMIVLKNDYYTHQRNSTEGSDSSRTERSQLSKSKTHEIISLEQQSEIPLVKEKLQEEEEEERVSVEEKVPEGEIVVHKLEVEEIDSPSSVKEECEITCVAVKAKKAIAEIMKNSPKVSFDDNVVDFEKNQQLEGGKHVVDVRKTLSESKKIFEESANLISDELLEELHRKVYSAKTDNPPQNAKEIKSKRHRKDKSSSSVHLTPTRGRSSHKEDKTLKSRTISKTVLPVTSSASEPSITVDRTSKKSKTCFSKDSESDAVKTTHQIRRNGTKVVLKTKAYYGNTPVIKEKSEKVREDEGVKEVWFTRLKQLLAEQEKILQQEKNLKALSKWRLIKKMEPPRSSDTSKLDSAPFATDPEYSKMLSRADLSKRIDQIMDINKNAASSGQAVNINELLAEVVKELQGIQVNRRQTQTPRTEKRTAGTNIESILELHKRIIALQSENDKT